MGAIGLARFGARRAVRTLSPVEGQTTTSTPTSQASFGIGGIIGKAKREQKAAAESAAEAERKAKIKAIEERLQERFRIVMGRSGGRRANPPLLLGGTGGGL